MTVVFDRPYKFVPPHRGKWWPTFIQTFRLYNGYLQKREGVYSSESRGLENLKEPLERGDGILLAPNHCRYADPLVLGWPARELNTYLYAMASWHLFNESWFDSFALQKMGAFSIYREGPDRQSLEMAIDILVTADRPLVIYPEGTTNRTNDVLKPLLDGITFIARSAARRRAKRSSGQVVLLPVGMKYLCKTDITDWADAQLTQLEERLGWSRKGNLSTLQRTTRLAEGLLSLREIEYLGESNSGALPHRRDHLIEQMLVQLEDDLRIPHCDDSVQARVSAIRKNAAVTYASSTDESEKQLMRDNVVAADLVQDISSYPTCYLRPDQATDTRVVETIQRMQETLYGKADGSMPLHAVIQFDQPIVVPAEKAPRSKPDPLMEQLADRLSAMLEALSTEANPIEDGASLRLAE
jgi:hypothetical protein